MSEQKKGTESIEKPTSLTFWNNLLSAKQVEKETNGALKASSLCTMRSTGLGAQLPVVKVGKKIYYRREDVQAFLEARYTGSVSA